MVKVISVFHVVVPCPMALHYASSDRLRSYAT